MNKVFSYDIQRAFKTLYIKHSIINIIKINITTNVYHFQRLGKTISVIIFSNIK